jgi:hypothetical protein
MLLVKTTLAKKVVTPKTDTKTKNPSMTLKGTKTVLSKPLNGDVESAVAMEVWASDVSAILPSGAPRVTEAGVVTVVSEERRWPS